PATVTEDPSTVFCSPTIWSGETWAGSTWYVRILVSVPLSVLSFAIVAAGTLANAASTGAKTVNCPPLSVSTRFTFGFSLPDTAAALEPDDERRHAAVDRASTAAATRTRVRFMTVVPLGGDVRYLSEYFR